MKTEKVAKPKPIVMFAECKKNPGKLQIWFPSQCIIYSRCASCGTVTSYEEKHGLVDYVDHYDFFEIELKKNRGEDWDQYWDRAKQLVLQDMQKYSKK